MGALTLIAAKVDSGDTAWMLMATALVVLMTPALGLFYAGLVRSKNTLNTFMMCVAALAVATVAWAAVGYSFAFADGNGFIGGFGFAFLHGVDFAPKDEQTIPHLLFMAFQGSFCIITVALVSGAVAERMRFGPFLVFAGLWSVLVYAVLAHWVFGGGWLQERGHAGLRRRRAGGDGLGLLGAGRGAGGGRAARLRPRRRCCPTTPCTCCWGRGCCGSAGSASTAAAACPPATPGVLAFTNTLLTPACTLVVWFALDLIRGRQVTAIGAATAIIVGCVAITPAGGFISPGWAMALGAFAALPSYAVILWRPRTRVDETLDVLAAHGIAGFTGILFIGVFASAGWNGVDDGPAYGNLDLLGHQALAAVAAPAYAFGAT